jgi:hypothetical protein
MGIFGSKELAKRNLISQPPEEETIQLFRGFGSAESVPDNCYQTRLKSRADMANHPSPLP